MPRPLFEALEAGPLPMEKPALRLLLRGLPWAWPAESGIAERRAIELVGERPTVPAAVPLLTVATGRASLWAWSPDELPDFAEATPLGDDAKRALRYAGRAVARTLPVAWRAPPSEPSEQVAWVASMPDAPVGGVESVVDGRSLGLGFALGLAARTLERPLPSDRAASATVSEFGGVGPVDGLARKLALIVERAPRVRQVLVAQVQEDEAGRLLQSLGAEGVDVVGIADLAHAVRAVFGDDLLSGVVEAGIKDARVQARVERYLLHLARSGRSELLAWGPVARAARRVRESGRTDDPQRDGWLRLLEANALRHEGHVQEQPSGGLPSLQWLHTLPAPAQPGVLANLVQHHADTGQAPPDGWPALEAEVRDRIGDRAPITPGLGQLLGAWGRWLATTEPDLSLPLAVQRRAVQLWLDLYMLAECSHPLCEGLRLAGIAGDAVAFRHLSAIIEQIDGLPGAIHPGNESYLRLAHGTATLRLAKGLAERRRARQDLSRVAAGLVEPTVLHVRAAALRALGRFSPRQAHEAESQLTALLEAQVEHRCRETVEVQALLLALERALDRGEPTVSRLSKLEDLRPQGLEHILRAAPASAAARWVVERYPY